MIKAKKNIPENKLSPLKGAIQSLKAFLPDRTHIQHFQALLFAAQKGLKIDLVIDPDFSSSELTPSYYEQFQEAGGNLYFLDKKNRTAFSKKLQAFYILDRNRVLTGSPQWTHSPLLNGNHFRFIDEPLLIQFFEKEFNHLISGCDLEVHSSEVPLDIQLTTSSEIVEMGKDFEINWRVENADWVKIEPGFGQVEIKGRRIHRLYESSKLKVTAGVGKQQKSKIFFIPVSNIPRIEYKLTTKDLSTGHEFRLYSPKDFPGHFSIIQGQVITLYWTTQNASKIQIDNIGKVAQKGVQTLVPDKLTSYTIMAKNESHICRKVIAVNVFPMPTIERVVSHLPNPLHLRSQIAFQPLTIPDSIFEERAPFHLNLPVLERLDVIKGEAIPENGRHDKKEQQPLLLLKGVKKIISKIRDYFEHG